MQFIYRRQTECKPRKIILRKLQGGKQAQAAKDGQRTRYSAIIPMIHNFTM